MQVQRFFLISGPNVAVTQFRNGSNSSQPQSHPASLSMKSKSKNDGLLNTNVTTSFIFFFSPKSTNRSFSYEIVLSVRHLGPLLWLLLNGLELMGDGKYSPPPQSSFILNTDFMFANVFVGCSGSRERPL